MQFLRRVPDLVITTSTLSLTEAELAGLASDDALTALLGTAVSGGVPPYVISYTYNDSSIIYPVSPLAGSYEVTINAIDDLGNIGSKIVTILVTA